MDNSSSDGITFVNSCRIIEALIYGPNPRVIIEKFLKPPPLKRSNNPKNTLFPKYALMDSKFIPGTGM